MAGDSQMDPFGHRKPAIRVADPSRIDLRARPEMSEQIRGSETHPVHRRSAFENVIADELPIMNPISRPNADNDYSSDHVRDRSSRRHTPVPDILH